MTFCETFLLIIVINICILLNVWYIYECHRDKNCSKSRKWFIYISSCICTICLIITTANMISNRFNRCLKKGYYNGISVKTVPKLNNQYIIEDVDSIFYINNTRE